MVVSSGRLTVYAVPLGGTLLLTALLTVIARRYVRWATHIPALMSADILVSVAIVIGSGGWDSPFILHAYSSLVMPALLFGWRGGVMAGLTFVAIQQAALTAMGMPASERIFENSIARLSVLLMLIVPPMFGALFSVVIERIRAQDHAHRPDEREQSSVDRPFTRDERYDVPIFGGSSRSADRHDTALSGATLAADLTRTRTAEQSVEELRRVIFAPLPAPEMDLAATLDVLSMRFGQFSSLPVRVTLIGRTRAVGALECNLLVRLTQEAMLNVQQHAHASSVSLTLRYDISSVALLIQDDGVGLVDGTYERPGLHALRAMYYRVSELGGRLDVFQTEGGGVTVRAAMPLE
jgi:signal transduction histidine kinase